MASLGKPLNTPESGWTRFNDTDKSIEYNTFVVGAKPWTDAAYGNTWSYWGSTTMGVDPEPYMKIRFMGTGVRIVGDVEVRRAPKVRALIDGVEESFTCKYNVTKQPNSLMYEKMGLNPNVIHELIIDRAERIDPLTPFCLTCIDIQGGMLMPVVSRDYEFPIGIIDKADLVELASEYVNDEEQLLITRAGEMFLTDGKGTYIECGVSKSKYLELLQRLDRLEKSML